MPRNYTPLPWKKTFHKIPPQIADALAHEGCERVKVACTKVLAAAEFEAGVYRHLCLATRADVPAAVTTFLPSPNVGPASHANVVPLEEQRKDLGKVPKRIRGRAPNGRGWGFHPITYTRPVWFTRLVVPAMTHLAVAAVGQRDGGAVEVRFEVAAELVRSAPDFDAGILRALNLLQENVGSVGVAAATEAEVGAWRREANDLGWRLLQTREANAAESELLRRVELRQPGRGAIAQQRLAVLRDLKPRQVWHSSRGYVGFVLLGLTDSAALVDNLEADDALYLVRRSAAELSRLDAAALRATLADTAERVVHAPGWEDRLRAVVAELRGESPDGQATLL